MLCFSLSSDSRSSRKKQYSRMYPYMPPISAILHAQVAHSPRWNYRMPYGIASGFVR